MKYPHFISLFPVRTWNVLIEKPKFMKWARLCVDPGLYPSQAEDLLTSSILFIVPVIEISANNGLDTVESLLQVVSEEGTPKLKKMTLQSATSSPTQLSPDILAGASVKLEELKIESQLSSVQLEAILTRSAGAQDSKLRKLVINQRVDRSGMNPDILAQALIKLESVRYNGFFVNLSLVSQQGILYLPIWGKF